MTRSILYISFVVALTACQGKKHLTIETNLGTRYEAALTELTEESQAILLLLDSTVSAKALTLVHGTAGGIIKEYSPVPLDFYPLPKSLERELSLLREDSDNIHGNENLDSNLNELSFLLGEAWLDSISQQIHFVFGLPFESEHVVYSIHPDGKAKASLMIVNNEQSLLSSKRQGPFNQQLRVPARRWSVALSKEEPKVSDVLYGYCELESMPYFQASYDNLKLTKRKWRASFYFKAHLGQGRGTLSE
jgi:hypothetical protein